MCPMESGRAKRGKLRIFRGGTDLYDGVVYKASAGGPGREQARLNCPKTLGTSYLPNSFHNLVQRTLKMQFTLALIAFVASAMATPMAVPEAAPEAVPEAAPEPQGKYGSYGTYATPSAPAGGYGNYRTYAPPAGGYGSYGTYKKD